MNKRYTNNRQREIIALLSLPIAYVGDAEQDELFKPALKEIRTARTNLQKAMLKVGEQLQPEEAAKFNRIDSRFKVKLVPISDRSPNQMVVNIQDVFDLAEFAVGQNCFGCQKHDWKKCKLRQVLMSSVEIPAANDTRGECPYKQ